MRKYSLVPTLEASAAGLKLPLPPVEDADLAKRVYVENLKGAKAFRMESVGDASALQGFCIDPGETYLLTNSKSL